MQTMAIKNLFALIILVFGIQSAHAASCANNMKFKSDLTGLYCNTAAKDTAAGCGDCCGYDTCASCSTYTCTGHWNSRSDASVRYCMTSPCTDGDAPTCCQADNNKCGSRSTSCGNDKFRDPAKFGNTYNANSNSEQANCCTNRARCSDFNCPAGMKKKQSPDTYCATSTCTGSESSCCEVDSTKCRYSNSGQICASTVAWFKDVSLYGVDNENTVCCTARAKCSTYTCPVAQKLKSNSATEECLGSVCTASSDNSRCCEADNNKCGSRSTNCGNTKFRDSTKYGNTYNANSNSEEDNCCTNRAKCSTSFSCGVARKKRSDADSRYCTSSACSTAADDANCCENDNDKCGSRSTNCGNDKFRDSAKYGNTYNANSNSEQDNCCTSKATCSAHTCSTGNKKKNSPSTYCSDTSSSCSVSDEYRCCENDDDYCGGSSVNCPAGQFHDPAKAGNWKGANSNSDHRSTCACCSAKATCSAWTGSCAAGQHKTNSYCPGNAGTCSATHCCANDPHKCLAFSATNCPNNYVKNPNAHGNLATVCCTARATCDGYNSCPAWAVKSSSTLCSTTSSTCTEAGCCNVDPTKCRAVPSNRCPSNQVKDSSKDAQLAAMCCADRGTCSAFQSHGNQAPSPSPSPSPTLLSGVANGAHRIATIEVIRFASVLLLFGIIVVNLE